MVWRISVEGGILETVFHYMNMEAVVADLKKFGNGFLHLDLNFSRTVHDWELESLLSFMNVIYSISMRGNGEDRFCWMPSKRSGFKVKSYCQTLISIEDANFLWKGIWKTKVPPRVALFSWIVELWKILTINNLRKRNLILID